MTTPDPSENLLDELIGVLDRYNNDSITPSKLIAVIGMLEVVKNELLDTLSRNNQENEK